MFYYHFKTAFRQALRHKGYSVINLLGLVVGLVSFILIILWVQDERSMNRFFSTADRLYAVKRNVAQSGGPMITTPWTPHPLAAVLREDYPEIENVTAVTWETESLFRLGDKASYEKGRYVSPEFFHVFTFPFLAGDANKALNDVNAIVISEKMARKFFGENWAATALGKNLTVNQQQEFVVTGIIEDPGPHSSLQFDWIEPEGEFIRQNQWVNDWHNGGSEIYFTLKHGSDINMVRSRAKQEVNKHTNNEADEQVYIQAYADAYLYGTFENGIPVGGRIQYVRILAAIAIFILLIACINFMNLATARSSTRAKEIAVKKVMGVASGSLRIQFLVESFLHTTVAAVVAIFIVYITLPLFNTLTGKSIALNLGDFSFWEGIAVIVLTTGILSGSYPAIFMPAMKTIASLKGKGSGKTTAAWLRRGLATFQFGISIFLITGTIVVARQLHYLLNKDLGLDKENVVLVNMEGELARKNELFRTALTQLANVKDVTFTSGNPISSVMSTGGATWEGKDPNAKIEINVMNVDAHFFETLKTHTVSGTGFSNDYKLDSAHFVVNEVMANIMGFKDPVGKRLGCWGTDGIIIGVVGNFHISSLYDPIQPLIIRYDPIHTGTALIRTQGSVHDAIAQIQKITRKLNPAFPFRYEFMSEAYNQYYKSEMTISTLLDIFAAVSIFISCLGLLGLSSFAADLRSREIGIRKVHGAKTITLVVLLSREYAGLMVIAFVLAAPVAWYFTHRWLETFAFRTDVSPLLFVMAGMFAFVMGALTVGVRSLQASLSNPVKVLREE